MSLKCVAMAQNDKKHGEDNKDCPKQFSEKKSSFARLNLLTPLACPQSEFFLYSIDNLRRKRDIPSGYWPGLVAVLLDLSDLVVRMPTTLSEIKFLSTKTNYAIFPPGSCFFHRCMKHSR